jgi:hypothetical protein
VAWASWVNAHGGINGHPVQLIVKDNKGDQAQAVSLVKQLVEQDHVVAFVSNQDGSLNAGYASYLDQQKIPVLGGSVFTLDPWVSDPMFYPEGLTAIQDMTSLAVSAKQLGISTVGSLACSEAPQCAAANGLAKAVFAGAGIPDTYGHRLHGELPDRAAEGREGAHPARSHRLRGPGHRRRLPAPELQPELHHPRRGNRRRLPGLVRVQQRVHQLPDAAVVLDRPGDG